MDRRFGNAPKRHGISLQCAGRDDVQPKSEADSNQSQLTPSRVLRSQCLHNKKNQDSQNFSRNRIATFQFVSKWVPISARHVLQRRGPSGFKHIEIRCLALQQWMRENVCRWVEWTRRTILQISSPNIRMDRARRRSQGNLDFETWKVRTMNDD